VSGPGGAGGRAHDDWSKDAAAARAAQEERRIAARDADAGGSGAEERDMTPALGHAGGPASWQRGEDGAEVALHVGHWRDGRWSYLYGSDTAYAPQDVVTNGDVAAAAHAARSGRDVPIDPIQGPIIHGPVWTWEIGAYFWLGGIASGSSFIALACDLAGDEESARVARAVSLAAILPSPVLLIMDLGRPARFLNMLRIFKVRSPMSMGAWCLSAFSATLSGAVAADLLGRPREAKALGGATALLGSYLGSYTGVLLASTAVPLWARSRLFLGPVFVSTAVATGAAATRLALVATGLPDGHPTRRALGTIETAAMTSELVLSAVNERRLGDTGAAMEHGVTGTRFRAAKGLVRAGLGLRLLRGVGGRRVHDLASVLYLIAGLLFRYAWVGAGKVSAEDDQAVARMARGKAP
jgi:formate-dependent nitrite reductase membrane component NrfD